MSVDKFDERPWLILCEGESDKRFFHNLIGNRGIPDEFQIRFPDRANKGGGRSNFGYWLKLMRTASESFRSNIQGVLIVSDNDEVPATSFQEVQAALQESNGFPIPDAERTVVKKNDYPAIMIWMLPTNRPGSLETIVLEAVFHKWPNVRQPVDKFLNDTAANAWKPTKKSKMQLQSAIAATCEGRPDCGFMGLWHEKPEFHIPLDHNTFNELEQFLRGFGALVMA